MLRRTQTLPEPRLRHERVDGVGVREEHCLGQNPDLDYPAVYVTGEGSGGREKADGFGGGVDQDGPGRP